MTEELPEIPPPKKTQNIQQSLPPIEKKSEAALQKSIAYIKKFKFTHYNFFIIHQKTIKKIPIHITKT